MLKQNRPGTGDVVSLDLLWFTSYNSPAEAVLPMCHGGPELLFYGARCPGESITRYVNLLNSCSLTRS